MIRELMQTRAQHIADARKILDAAEAEKRSLSQEEQNSYDGLLDKASALQATIDRRQQQDALETSLRDSYQPGADASGEGDGDGPAYEFRSRALQCLNETGIPEAMQRRGRPEYQRAFTRWAADGLAIGADDQRALQADNETLGGALVAPLQMVDRLIQAVDNAVYIRQWATVLPLTEAASLGAVSLDTDPADPTWTSEIGSVGEDSSMALGRRELAPNLLAKLIKVSRRLLRLAPNAEDLVVSRLAYKFGVTFEANTLTGNGAKQPLGVFTASSDGISTGRDVSTGNTTTSIQFDGLIEAKYTLKQQYWPRAKWLFHRDGMKQIAKLKDGDGQYIWRESVRAGEPDRVLGVPAFMSEYAPSTFTTGLYVGILGDFSYYWIVDSLAMEMQRLQELYARTNQVGLIGRMESDGQPVLEEAFVRVKLA
jgi:HK97 family phage major capsid protein